MKKVIWAILVGLLTISIFAETKPVVVAYKGSKEWQDWLNITVKDFEKKFPDKKVKLFPILTQDDINYEVKIAMLLKNNPEIDLAFIDSFPTLHSYINANLIDPYPDMQKWDGWNQIYDYMKDGAQKNGKYYCIPVASGNIVLFYNIEQLKKSGINVPWEPKTWKDVIDAAEKIKKTFPDIWPIWMCLKGNNEATTMFVGLSLLYGTNDRLFENGKWVVTSKGLLDTFSFIATLTNKKLIPPQPVILDKMGDTRMQKEYTPKQKIAIFLDGGWFKNLCWTGDLEKNRSLFDETPFPTENGQAPGFISMAGGWSVAMCAKSSNKAAAWDFLKYLTSKESMLKASIYSTNTSPRKDVLTMKGYPEVLKKPTEMLKYGQHRPTAENYALVSKELSTAMESVVIGCSPKQAMDNFANNVEMTLGKDKCWRKL